MSTPLALNDAEIAAVQAAAAPIHLHQRDAFLKALAKELALHPVLGPASCTAWPPTCSAAMSSKCGRRPRSQT